MNLHKHVFHKHPLCVVGFISLLALLPQCCHSHGNADVTPSVCLRWKGTGWVLTCWGSAAKVSMFFAHSKGHWGKTSMSCCSTWATWILKIIFSELIQLHLEKIWNFGFARVHKLTFTLSMSTDKRVPKRLNNEAITMGLTHGVPCMCAHLSAASQRWE